MDPVTMAALIGAGSSLIGGFMNTSSTQAINAANVQEQMWSAQGGYLPGLVQNAERAGLSPLAVLGSRGPNMAVQVGTQPGAGLQAAGREIAGINPYKAQEEELATKLGQSNIDRIKAEASNAKNQAAMSAHALDVALGHPGLIPPGWSEPTPTGVITENVHNALTGVGRVGSDAWRDYIHPALSAAGQYFGPGGAYNRDVTDVLGR